MICARAWFLGGVSISDWIQLVSSLRKATLWSGRLAVLSTVLLLSACARPEAPGTIRDPYESRNRQIHEANKSLDRGVFRPVSTAYGKSVPRPVRTGVSNFASNLSLPGAMINSLLQFRPGDAVQNGTRFLINTTVGLGGIFDPATRMGATKVDTDFGETLYVWGMREGAYVEFPVLGPMTERAMIGRAVDFAMNPLRPLANSEERNVMAGTGVLRGADARYENSDLVDSVLYESADSYAQSRQIYLDSRRHKLSRNQETDYFDPYEDPYEDPNAQ